MAAAKVSEHALAKHLEISYQAVKKILEGKTGHFSVPNHFAAAHFLNVDPEWLASGVSSEEAKASGQDSAASFYRSPFSADLTNELNQQQPPTTQWIESIVGLLLAGPAARAQNVLNFARGTK